MERKTAKVNIKMRFHYDGSKVLRMTTTMTMRFKEEGTLRKKKNL
jgi:hypothetical protein